MKRDCRLLRILLDDRVATSDDLPDDPWRYFLKVSGAVVVPLEKLQTIRARPTGIENASKHMANAYNGSGARRKPIQLKKNPDGTFTVLDGNSTTAIAKKHGWKGIPALVEHEGFKAGTIRKWASGSVIKTSGDEWVPYKGSSQHRSLAPIKNKDTVAGVRKNLAKISAVGRGPVSNHNSLEHFRIAKKFLNKHQQGLHDCVARFEGLVGGEATIISARTKTVESALGKLSSKPKYGTADQLKDGTGVRIVSKTTQDVLANVEKIKKRFETSAADEEDYINHPKDGYRSYHLIIKDDDGLWKEIQLRTPNQDTWGNWAHDIYKPMTSEQEAALAVAGPEIRKYAEDTSNYYYAKDSGAIPSPPPDCSPVVKTTFGCLPA